MWLFSLCQLYIRLQGDYYFCKDGDGHEIGIIGIFKNKNTCIAVGSRNRHISNECIFSMIDLLLLYRKLIAIVTFY